MRGIALLALISVSLIDLSPRTVCRASPDLSLPPGFCATVFADGVGRARHIAVSPSGDLFVQLWAFDEGPPRGSVVALRDTDRDGRSDRELRFGERGGDDIEWHRGYLYASTSDSIIRYKLPSGSLRPVGDAEVVVKDIPTFDITEHNSHTFTFIGDRVLVHLGAPSNACQQKNRAIHSPGIDPCPLVDSTAGVWQFEGAVVGQPFSGGKKIVSGLRHTMGMSTTESGDSLAIVHGRDELHTNWPEMFSELQGADLPADELVELKSGNNFGWPYCFYDPQKQMRIQAPEYGGDGNESTRCPSYTQPLLAIPAHSAPNDLLLYTGSQFPSKYRGAAFIALHGGWGRTPFVQNGYKVVYIPFKNGRPTGEIETFADGFAGIPEVTNPSQARFRPVGLAQAPDGSVFIADSRKGRIWKVTFTDSTQ